MEEGWILRENVCGGKVVDVEEVWMWREVECLGWLVDVEGGWWRSGGHITLLNHAIHATAYSSC